MKKVWTIIGIKFILVTTIFANDVPSSHCSFDRVCCKTESLNTVLETVSTLTTTLQEMITAVKSQATELSGTVCGNSINTEEDDCWQKAYKKRKIIYPDCSTLQRSNHEKKSGIYQIWPRFYNEPFQVYCDFNTDGGGWTVFQRRNNYSTAPVDFYRTWIEYKNGFGNLSEEFWLGNDKIFALANSAAVSMRIDLEDFEGEKRYSLFERFVIDGELQHYRLNLSGHSGNAGDSFLKHNGHTFKTKDLPNNTCPKLYKGGWWYSECHTANLNGQYLKGKHDSYADGVNFHSFKGYHYSLKMAEMKIRAEDFRVEIPLAVNIQ